jgi:PilZ domain
MPNYLGDEKRKYMRLDGSYILSYRPKEGYSDYDSSLTANISQGGAIFTTAQEFFKGDILLVLVRFPFISQKIEITCEVIDSKEKGKGTTKVYDTRVKFLGLSQEWFTALGEFIAARKKRENKSDI